MVKGVPRRPGQSEPPSKKPLRPPDETGDRRTERIAIRAHPDLVTELNFLARDEGLVRSVLIERILIAYINDTSPDGPRLDMIGRSLPEPTGVPSKATGLAPLRTGWRGVRERGGHAIPPEPHPKRRRRPE